MPRVLLVALGWVAACAPWLPLVRLDSQAKPGPETAEPFYSATTVKALREGAAAVRAASPDSALRFEVQAQLQGLDAQEDAAFESLMAALADTQNDAALLHVNVVGGDAWTRAHRRPTLALMRALAERHPDASVRAAAAWYAAHQLGLMGDLDGRAQLLNSIPGRVPLAVVGTWDNEQGKGFEQELAPETRPELNERYAGRSHPLAWRRDAPVDPRGRYDLGALMQPNRWVVAFAQGTLEAPADGLWALRITTSEPLKVWVDGKLVFSAVQLDGTSFENVVVPVDLKQGAHRLLIKSAQRDGTWTLCVRATPATPEEFPTRFDSVKGMLEWRVHHILGPGRRAALMAQWARLTVGGLTGVQTADGWARSNPQGLLSRLNLVDALWFNQERGRTADLLQTLDAEAGDELVFLRLRAIRFQQQQGLKLKARERLLKLLEKSSDRREAQYLLADMFQQEGWLEDELKLERENLENFSPSSSELFEHARTLFRDGRIDEARALLESLLDELPGHTDAIRRLAELAMDSGDLAEAERQTLWRLRVWPTDINGWTTLAEIYRRQGARAAADEALRHAIYLSPDWATAYASRAQLAYEAADKEAAVELWKTALALNPENERLANRLDYLAPASRAPWADDVPDEDALAAAVASRTKIKPVAGADVAYLMDHEVTQLASDGSTQNVVTLVLHAFNAAGRDRLTRQTVSTAGRLRMLHAFAVDPNGNRTEAASERAGAVFFRNLAVGSTVVLQYRNDEPAKGYLSRYLTKNWSFQGLADQRVQAQFVLWMPLATKLHETTVGSVKREESARGQQLRIAWRLSDAAPLVAEPAMPTVQELAANIRLSTVPDWDAWLSWEKALLVGAFRSSPEVDAVAERLAQTASEPLEKARRVHEFVMEEIRYQQDYESFIAGVKPHAAPMVLERKYGDCKDKAVLFITLAKKLGLDAHFALVRTRDSGPVDPDVPMQQFNHAIVYVPAQAGIAEGRFFDPTADALDLDVVRADDTGTRSLVFDPATGQHTWREISFQGPELNQERWSVSLKLQKDGSANGELSVSAVGRSGSMLRRTARNLEQTAQLMQRQVQRLVNNAQAGQVTVGTVKDLRQPAQLSTPVSSKALARVEGEELRMKLPSDFNLRGVFSLSSRRHPLVLGVPSESITSVSIEVPDGLDVTRLPADAEVTTPCLHFSRKLRRQGNTVQAELRGRSLCERIGPAEYARYQASAEDVSKLLDEELVMGKSKGPRPPAKAAPR